MFSDGVRIWDRGRLETVSGLDDIWAVLFCPFSDVVTDSSDIAGE